MLKDLANWLAILIILPLVVTHVILSAVGNRDRSFAAHVQLLSLWPGTTGVFLRRAFFRLTLTKCSDTVAISFGTLFCSPACSLGRHIYIGPYGSIGAVDIEDDVLIGSHVSIPNGGKQHGIDRLDIPVREQPGEWQRIHIETDTWIGDRAIVMANVGRHCIVGAGAVVTKAVEDYAIVVGCPARVINYRNQLEPGDTNTQEILDVLSRNES
ncbi:MAG: acyltransferase [Pirellulales bacterium]